MGRVDSFHELAHGDFMAAGGIVLLLAAMREGAVWAGRSADLMFSCQCGAGGSLNTLLEVMRCCVCAQRLGRTVRFW